MAGIITVILILIFSILITRVASIALSHTGLSRETSKFQARSAFTGVGFTTSESEKVVNHPVRRRILLILMILGNAGIVGGVASLMIGFTDISGAFGTWIRIAVLVGGVIILWNVANSRWVDRQLSNFIDRLLKKYSRLEVKDYDSLLHLSGDYRISEIPIENNHWLKDQDIKDSRLRSEGVTILAITRNDGTFLGTPHGTTTIQEGDSLIVYGRVEALSKLERRSKGKRGDQSHRKMMDEQKKVVKKEEKKDPAETG